MTPLGGGFRVATQNPYLPFHPTWRIISLMNTYTDTEAGAIKCLEDSTEDKAVAYIKAALETGEFRLERDPEHEMVWGLRGNYKTLAIFWLESEDVEFSDELLERIYN